VADFFLNAIGAPAKLRAHLQSRAVQKISRRHGALAFGSHFGDSQSRRAAARDDEAAFSRFANGPRLEFTRAPYARFDARFDDLEPVAVEKSMAAWEGRESAQPVENLCGGHRPIDFPVFALEDRR
jgi:hypothetical protein